MPTVLCGVFAAHLNRRGLTAADGEAWLFVDGRNGPLRYEHWRTRVWGPAVVRAGMPNLTFHDLRRTNATAMVLEGVDMKTAQTRLGHSDPRLTLPCMRKQRPKRTTSRRTRSLGE